MDKSNLFRKTNIKNRFIAVKYANIPKNTEDSFTIPPLCDGLGFKINLSASKEIGLNFEDINYLKNELKKINKIIIIQYSLYKKNETPNLISKKMNDRLLYISFGLSIIFFIFIQISNTRADFNLFLIGFLGYLAILVVLIIFLCKNFFLKIKHLPNFSVILKKYLKPIFEDIKKYFGKRNFQVNSDDDFFWIQICNNN